MSAFMGANAMAIVVERRPYVVVTDEESGWSLTGGRSYPDGSSTKEMTHRDGASCTLHLMDQSKDRTEHVLRVIGMLYLNPGELKGKHLRKEPSPGDFVSASELYAVAGKLTRAWYEATYKTTPPLRIVLPKH